MSSRGNQVLVVHLAVAFDDQGAARDGELRLHELKLLADDAE
jgi:hypothetical protein